MPRESILLPAAARQTEPSAPPRCAPICKSCTVFPVIAWLLVSSVLSAAPLPTPEQFAGFRMGAETKLVRWERIVEYMRLAASSSQRVKVDELGKTTNGNPFVSVTISAPDTLKNLNSYKATQQRLAYPRDLGEAEA